MSYFYLMTKDQSKTLQYPPGNDGLKPGSLLTMEKKTADPNQQWQANNDSIICSKQTGYGIDASGGEGENVKTGQITGSDQKWTFDAGTNMIVNAVKKHLALQYESGGGVICTSYVDPKNPSQQWVKKDA